MTSEIDNVDQNEELLDRLRIFVVNWHFVNRGDATVRYSDIADLGLSIRCALEATSLPPCRTRSESAITFLRTACVYSTSNVDIDSGEYRAHSIRTQLATMLDPSPRAMQHIGKPPFQIALLKPSLTARTLLLNHDAVRHFAKQHGPRIVLTELDELWSRFYFLDADALARYRLFWELCALHQEGRLAPYRSSGFWRKLIARFSFPKYNLGIAQILSFSDSLRGLVHTRRVQAGDFNDWLRRTFALFPQIAQLFYMLRLSRPLLPTALGPWFFVDFGVLLRLEDRCTDEQTELLQRLKHDLFEVDRDFAGLFRDPAAPMTTFFTFALTAASERGLRAGIRELDGSYRWHVTFPAVVRDRMVAVMEARNANPPHTGAPIAEDSTPDQASDLYSDAEGTVIQVLSSLSPGFSSAMSLANRETLRLTAPRVKALAKHAAKIQEGTLADRIIAAVHFAHATSTTRVLPAQGIAYKGYAITASATPSAVDIFIETPDLLFVDVWAEHEKYVSAVMRLLDASLSATHTLRGSVELDGRDVLLRLAFESTTSRLVIRIVDDGISDAVIDLQVAREAHRQQRIADEAMQAAIIVLVMLRQSLIERHIPIYSPARFAYTTEPGGPVIQMNFTE